jgi:hypothetical protein
VSKAGRSISVNGLYTRDKMAGDKRHYVERKEAFKPKNPEDREKQESEAL